MNAETTLSRVLVALGLENKPKNIEIALEQKKLADGQATFDAKTFEVGSAIFVITPDGNIPAPMGEYQMEDGLIISVDDKGYIAEISTMEEEASPEEEVVPTEEVVPMTEEMAKPKKMTESMIKTTEYSAEIAEFKKELETMKLKLSAMSEENAELTSRLASEEAPRSFHTPTNQLTKKVEFQMGSRREETTTDRVFKQLFS